MADHETIPEVPDLALATDSTATSGPVTVRSRSFRELSRVVTFDDDPRDEPSLELAIEPRKPEATGVRSWPCPVCQAELPRSVSTCPECGERMVEEAPFATSAYVVVRNPEIEPRPAPRWMREVSDLLPMSVAKRLFLYPMLLAFFANLLVPCRFHSTGICVVMAAVGFVGVVANHRTQPL